MALMLPSGPAAEAAPPEGLARLPAAKATDPGKGGNAGWEKIRLPCTRAGVLAKPPRTATLFSPNPAQAKRKRGMNRLWEGYGRGGAPRGIVFSNAEEPPTRPT